MNEKCFQFYLLRAETRKSDGTIESSRLFTEYSSEAEEAIDALLSQFDTDATDFFIDLDETNRKQQRWPWAIVLYEKEFRLAGHVLSMRQNREDLSFSSYSMNKGLSLGQHIEKHAVPPFSFFLLHNKAAIAAAAEKSPLFQEAWRLLADKDEYSHWICIAPPPPNDWVIKTSVGDDELFLRTLGLHSIQAIQSTVP
jgi:hypothetical protein